MEPRIAMIPKTSRRRGRATILLATLGALGIGASGGCHSDHGEAPLSEGRSETAIPFIQTGSRLETLEESIPVLGDIRGWEEVTVGAKREGRVVSIPHDIGDLCEPGEILARQETRDAELAVEQAERQLVAELARLGLDSIPTTEFDPQEIPSVARARLDLERAERDLERERSLSARNVAVRETLENRMTDQRVAKVVLENVRLEAKAVLAAAMAREVALRDAKQKLEDLIIRVPTPSVPPPGREGEGVRYAVAERMASEGQYLRPGDPVMRLVVNDPVKIVADVPESLRPKLRIGLKARIKVPQYPNRTFEGELKRIAPTADPSKRSFAVEILAENHSGELMPGGLADVRIVTDSRESTTYVPLEAITTSAGRTKIFLADLNALTAKEVEVRPGEPRDGWVPIDVDLAEGTPVIVRGQTKMFDGAKLNAKLTEPESGGAPGEAGEPEPVSADAAPRPAPSEGAAPANAAAGSTPAARDS